jgi:hypothetical protein
MVEERSRRCSSAFQVGWRWRRRCLTNAAHVLIPCYLLPSSLAPLKLS